MGYLTPAQASQRLVAFGAAAFIQASKMDGVEDFKAGFFPARSLQAERLRSPLFQLLFLHRNCRLSLRVRTIERRKAWYVVSENAIANVATRMRIETGTEGSFSSTSGLSSEFV